MIEQANLGFLGTLLTLLVACTPTAPLESADSRTRLDATHLVHAARADEIRS